MRLLILLLTSLHLIASQAQVRFGLQSGLSSLSEIGFKAQVATSVSLGWQFENKVSWGLQYGTTLKQNKNGYSSFSYCDSLVNTGWHNECVGNDSMISSDFTKIYNVNTLGVYLLKHKSLMDGKLDIAGGFSLAAAFLSRREQRFDKLLDYDQTERAIGLELTPLVRFSYFPKPKKTDFSFYIEGRVGTLFSPQYQCTDVNCDNFLERAINYRTLLQVGISY